METFRDLGEKKGNKASNGPLRKCMYDIAGSFFKCLFYFILFFYIHDSEEHLINVVINLTSSCIIFAC